MTREISKVLLRQHDIAWNLASYHLKDLNTNESLWRPSMKGLHIKDEFGFWHGDWPEHEGYDIGPPSIAWLLWHMNFWWSMVINHSFEDSTLSPEKLTCPNSSEECVVWLLTLHQKWKEYLSATSDKDLHSPERTNWPYQNRPFADVVAWVNIELTKNAAELGYARFLYATRTAV